MSVEISLKGLTDLERYFKRFPDASKEAAKLAINSGAKYGARRGSEAIRSQINLSRNYIGDASNSNSRLRITRVASGNDLEAVVSAREAPTSLARFAVGPPTFGKRVRGPRVKVKAFGSAVTIKKGFFMKLRRGSDEDGYNIGLAVRLKPGEAIRNKREMKSVAKGLYLLYGPSVAQIFSTVRENIGEDVASYTAIEFLRQFDRLTK